MAMVECVDANLLVNPGFESGSGEDATGWSRFDNAGRQTWFPRSGVASAVLYGWVSNNWGGVWQDVSGQTSDTWYVFSAYGIRETNFYANSVCLKLEWMDDSNTIYETEYELVHRLTNSWTRFSHMAKSPPGTKKVRVVIAGWIFSPPPGATTKMSCMFDDAELTTTNIPTVDPDLQDNLTQTGGMVRLSWPSYRDRHDEVWRSTYPGEWRKTYSSETGVNGTNRYWRDTEEPDNACAWYRVVRGEELIPGSTDRCTADGTTGVTYFRFLPTSYTTEGTNPLVIAMDPNGSGSGIASALRTIGERFGWVVIGCDTIRNGSNPVDNVRFDDILKDVKKRIPHDMYRRYLAGFSGGAARAYDYAQDHWDEFAGVVAYEGWICTYDDHVRFPDRLAIARLDAYQDTWHTGDVSYFSLTQCRWADFDFTGTHEIAPPPYSIQAAEWLTRDFASNGITYLPTDTVQVVPGMLVQAREAWRRADWQMAATQAVYLIHRYPFTWEADECEKLLVDIYSDTDKFARVGFDIASPSAPTQSWHFMNHAFRFASYADRERSMAMFELAYALYPSNSIVCANLSRSITENEGCPWREIERATELADAAIALSNVYWKGWFARAWAAAAVGDYHLATGCIVKAYKLTSRHPIAGNRQAACRAAKSEFESHLSGE